MSWRPLSSPRAPSPPWVSFDVGPPHVAHPIAYLVAMCPSDHPNGANGPGEIIDCEVCGMRFVTAAGGR